MSGGKKNPAVLWHKLGYKSNKIVGVVKNYFKAIGHQTITFDMQGRQVAVTDESANSVVLSAKEIEAIYFTAKSMGWMNYD